MFFIFSKIFNFFLDPLNILIISFLLFIIITAKRRKNSFRSALCFFVLWFLLYKPISDFLKRSEDRFVYNEEVFRLDVIIVLRGGTVSGKVAYDKNEYSLGEGSER